MSFLDRHRYLFTYVGIIATITLLVVLLGRLS